LDPPYNLHPYGSNYHLLNTIVKHKITEPISDISGIPIHWNKSNYNYVKKAEVSMKYLLQNCKSHYIILSYNNEGIISVTQMKQILHDLHYSYTIKTKEYTSFRGSRNRKARANNVYEYLWIIKKEVCD